MNPTAHDVFEAISHPARRRMLDLLADNGAAPVHTLAANFTMSRPAVSQHLRVLLDAGLVAEHRHGRERRYRCVPTNLETVRDWVVRYERFWDHNFDRLGRFLASSEER